MKPRAGHWGLVRVADGVARAGVLAWIDGAEWRGWIVPWLPDASLEELEWIYFPADDPGSGTPPWRSVSGEWIITDEEDETVRLERHRATVFDPNASDEIQRLSVALNDTGGMAWCWEEIPDEATAIPEKLAELVRAGDAVAAPRGRRTRRGKAAR